jgi:hypothetical protein
LAEINGGLKHVQPQIEKSLTKQIDRLHAAVDDAESDRHALRILVKRTRYLTEAFPKLSPLSGKAASSQSTSIGPGWLARPLSVVSKSIGRIRSTPAGRGMAPLRRNGVRES